MSDLLSQFEDDVRQNSALGFTEKIRRSQAARQIVAMGRQALPLIVRRLEGIKLNPKKDVSCAWASLMREIALNSKLHDFENWKLTDISAYIAWARAICPKIDSLDI